MVLAQSGTGFTGKVVDIKPIIMLLQKFQNTSLTNFRIATISYFQNVTNWKPIITRKSVGYKDQLLTIETEEGKILDLGVLV
jgi:hypothetical protein